MENIVRWLINNKPVTSGRVAISVLDMNMTTINVGESYEYYPFLPSTYDIKAYYLGNDEYNPIITSIYNGYSISNKITIL